MGLDHALHSGLRAGSPRCRGRFRSRCRRSRPRRDLVLSGDARKSCRLIRVVLRTRPGADRPCCARAAPAPEARPRRAWPNAKCARSLPYELQALFASALRGVTASLQVVTDAGPAPAWPRPALFSPTRGVRRVVCGSEENEPWPRRRGPNRLIELAVIVQRLARTITADAIPGWLNAAVAVLDGQRPLKPNAGAV